MIEMGTEFITRFVGWIAYGLVELFNKFIEFCGYILSAILGVLPTSPFNGVESFISDNKFLQYLGFVIPMPEIAAIFTSWLSAIAIWYVYQIILRWIKAIE